MAFAEEGVMSAPQVTAIITTFNAEHYIAETLHTITSQTLQAIQIIIVDDASTDNTVRILSECCATDERVTVLVNEENRGAGYSRNRAMALAKGDFVIFLDDDDLCETEMLAQAYGHAISAGADVVVFRSDNLDCLTHQRTPAPWTILAESLPASMTFTAFETRKNFFRTFIWWAWDKLIRRDLILRSDLQFQEIRTSNDLFFVCALLLQAKAISVCEASLISHRDNREGSLSNTRELSYECSLQAIRALYCHLTSQPVYLPLQRDFINYSIDFLSWSLSTLKHWPAYADFYRQIRTFCLQLPAIPAADIESEYLAACYQDLTCGDPETTLMKLKCRLEQDLRHHTASEAANQQQWLAEAERAASQQAELREQNRLMASELERLQQQVAEQQIHIRELQALNEQYQRKKTVAGQLRSLAGRLRK
ncbi:MAG: glycosyltransferase [Pseudomonadota bacterium]